MLGYFEEMALGSTSLKPSLWLRYIDDTFIFWLHQEGVQTVLDHVNSDYRYSSQWRSSEYRKSTFTEQYFNFKPHHPYNIKKEAVRCLQHRLMATLGFKIPKIHSDMFRKTRDKTDRGVWLRSAFT